MDEGGFWLVSHAARLARDLLRQEAEGTIRFAEGTDVLALWQNTADKDGNDCRAHYSRSEHAICIAWGARLKAHAA